jgi:hypothetical protein
MVYNNDNVAISINGTVNAAVFTSTELKTSTANLSANLLAGNAFVSGTVRAPTLTSNIADGTAPLVVTSKTRVANLNVDYANVSDYGVVKNTTTGTYYPVLSSGVVDGNYQFAGNSGLSYNVATGNLSATLLTGTLTTNSQPYINSVGRLSTLTVGGASQNTVFGSGTITANGLIQSQDLTVSNDGVISGKGNVIFTNTANVTLGAISNLHISGGTSGDFVQTDGAGTLTFNKPKANILTTVNSLVAGSGLQIVTDFTDPSFPAGKFTINQLGPVSLSATDSWASGGSSKNAYTDYTTNTVNTQNISITLSLVNATFAITATDTIVIGGIAITGTNITGLGITGTGGTYTISSTLLNSITGGSGIQTATSNTVSVSLTTTRGSYSTSGTTLTNNQPIPFNITTISGSFPASTVPYWNKNQSFNWAAIATSGATGITGNVTYTPGPVTLTSTGALSGTSTSIDSTVSYTITSSDYRGTGANGAGTRTIPTPVTATVSAATSYTPLFYKITSTSAIPTLTTSDSYLPQAYALGQGATTSSVTTSYLWIATPGTTAHTWGYTFLGSTVTQVPTVAGSTITISGQTYTLYGFAGFSVATQLFTVT